jgi:hypothetical protein
MRAKDELLGINVPDSAMLMLVSVLKDWRCSEMEVAS